MKRIYLSFILFLTLSACEPDRSQAERIIEMEKRFDTLEQSIEEFLRRQHIRDSLQQNKKTYDINTKPSHRMS